MTPPPGVRIQHPPSLAARLIRATRGLRAVRGWTRLSRALTATARGRFTVRDRGLYFTGDLGVMIDREVYLSGGYEADCIDLFLSCAPPDRRGVILDVGCNAGTHSLRFAQAFQAVHAFDPNPGVWAQFQANAAINRQSNVFLHKVGLGRSEAQAAFYSIDGDNHGLGTFSDSPQYDRPLQRIATARLVNGADYLAALGVGRVDAVKIDVQGFEAEVLEGLRPVLERDRPLVWVEAGGQAAGAIRTLAQMRAGFPYPIAVAGLAGVRGLLTHRWRLAPTTAELTPGDYVVTAAD
jgi:FkbM family methyltransferase